MRGNLGHGRWRYRSTAGLVTALWAACLCVNVTHAHAATAAQRADAVIHVAQGGSDTASCGSAAEPCGTIPFAYGLAANGDTIQVAAGTYTQTGPLLIKKPGLRLLGAKAGVSATGRTPGGPGETVITGAAGGAPYGLFTAAADDVVIDGFTFEGNPDGGGLATSEDASGYVVEDNIVTGNVVGLYPDSNGDKPSLFTGNFFVNNNNGASGGNGVFAYRPVANAVFTGNKFRDNHNAPINIAGNEVPGASHDITIADNDMDGEFGITLVRVSHVLITRNQMAGGWNAVQVSGGCADITVTHNDIRDKTRGGILLFAGFAAVTNTGITIADNLIKDTATVAGRYGIEISRTSDLFIRDNQIAGSGHGAIGFTPRGQDVPSEAATITRNTITGSGGPGISVAPGSYTGPMTVRFNRIVDNDPQRGILNDDASAAIDARLNWWGCNSMPAGLGCDHPAGTTVGTIEFGPWLMLRIHSTPADILAGQAAAILASLQRDSSDAVTAGPFFAPVTATFTAAPGHVSPDLETTTPDLYAQPHWPPGQPRPREICVRVDNQTVCLRFPAHPEVSLYVTKTVVPNPAQAGRPVTFTITIANRGPADAFGVTVDDHLAPVLAGATWTCVASEAPSRCAHSAGTGSVATTSADIAVGGTITYRVTGVLPANTSGQVSNVVTIRPPEGTADAGCTPGCSASTTVSWRPFAPVTG